MVNQKISIAPINDDDEEIQSNAEVVSALKKLIAKQEEQIAVIKQTDWKIWVMMNAVVDGLLANGSLKKDPRQPSS